MPVSRNDRQLIAALLGGTQLELPGLAAPVARPRRGPVRRAHADGLLAQPLTSASMAPITERQFHRHYSQALRALGFHVSHHYDSRFSDDGTRGFPDLVICGHGVLWFDELKREAGTVSDSQREWHRELRIARAEVNVWRPSDWETMVHRMETTARAPVPAALRALPPGR